MTQEMGYTQRTPEEVQAVLADQERQKQLASRKSKQMAMRVYLVMGMLGLIGLMLTMFNYDERRHTDGTNTAVTIGFWLWGLACLPPVLVPLWVLWRLYRGVVSAVSGVVIDVANYGNARADGKLAAPAPPSTSNRISMN